jgi:subtilisin family serine protease
LVYRFISGTFGSKEHNLSPLKMHVNHTDKEVSMTNVTRRQNQPILVILLAILFWFSLQGINPVHAEAEPTDLTDVVMVKFAANTTEAERTELVNEMGGEIIFWLDAISTAQVRLPANWAATRGGKNALTVASQSQFVQSVQFDSVVSGVPSDENVTDTQPRTSNSANSTIPMSPVPVNDADYNNPQMQVYAPDMINLRMAWNYTMGSPDIKIAILDSGILASHPEFVGRVLPGYDFVNNDSDPNDDYGHGTHVAGIAAAGANNGVGMLGVCPRCSIIPVKVLDQYNQGTWGNVAAGILFAVDAGANVINLSLGGQSTIQAVEDAIRYATQQNVLVVAAVGNGRSDVPFYPAAMAEVVGVAATRNDDTRWSLSNYGSFVEISAPGYAVYSTYHDLNNAYHGYNYMSGTSMAAPHVAGLAGLLFSQNPGLTVEALRTLMRTTAVDLGDPGWDGYFGHGRIDAFAALAAGAPVLAADASVSGIIWQDDNVNGQWEQEERMAPATLTIQLRNANNDVVAQTQPNTEGQWRIDSLYPGTYQIVAIALGNTRLTTNNSYTVQLQSGQETSGMNFGAVESLSFQVFVPSIQRGQ